MPKSGSSLIAQEPFRVGVCYWPQRCGADFFRHFNVDEVHEDFSIMSEMGINLARVQLDWEYFQPDPDALRCSALAHLLKLCDAAASEGIRIELLLFASPLGSSAALPSWLVQGDTQRGHSNSALDSGDANPFLCPSAQRAATNLVRGIARTVGGHQATWAYNLGDFAFNLVPRSAQTAAKAWNDNLRRALRAEDARHPVTCSISGRILISDDALRVDQVLSELDHCAIDCHDLARDIDQSAPETVAAFSCALTTALSGKPCLCQDLNPAAVVAGSAPGSKIAVDSVLDALHRVGALGALIGSFVDPPPQDDRSEPRMQSGLLEDSGEQRQHARAIVTFARLKPQIVRSATQPFSLDISADEYYKHPSIHAARLYREFSSR